MSSSKHIAKNSIKTMIKAALALFSVSIGMLTDESGKHRSKKSTIIARNGLAHDIMKNTARTVDNIKYNLKKSAIDYSSAPEKHIIETDEEIIVHLDLHGIKKEDIELKITDTSLKVKASFDITQEIENGNNITLNDRKTGIFKRFVQFPQKVVPSEAEASFKDGILTVEAPKVDKEENFQIEVK